MKYHSLRILLGVCHTKNIEIIIYSKGSVELSYQTLILACIQNVTGGYTRTRYVRRLKVGD